MFINYIVSRISFIHLFSDDMDFEIRPINLDSM